MDSSKISRPEKIPVQVEQPVPVEPQVPADPEPAPELPVPESYLLTIQRARTVVAFFAERLDAVEEVFRLRDDRNEWRAQAIAKEEENSKLRARITQLEASLEAAKGAGA